MREIVTVQELLDAPERALELTRGEAAKLLATAIARLAAPDGPSPNGSSEGSPEHPDRLLTVEEAAPLLALSVKALYARARRLPFARYLGRGTLRFSEAGLQRWMRDGSVDRKVRRH